MSSEEEEVTCVWVGEEGELHGYGKGVTGAHFRGVIARDLLKQPIKQSNFSIKL